MQIVGAGPIEVYPTLNYLARSVTPIDRDCYRGRTIGWHGYISGHSDTIIARAQSPGIIDARDRSAEGVRSKFRNRDAKRFGSAGRVRQCDGNRGRMAKGYAPETCRDRIRPSRRIRCDREIFTPRALRRWTDIV